MKCSASIQRFVFKTDKIVNFILNYTKMFERNQTTIGYEAILRPRKGKTDFGMGIAYGMDMFLWMSRVV